MARGVNAREMILRRLGVVRRVLVEKDDLASFQRLGVGVVAVPRQGGLGVTGEYVAAPRHLLHVFVLGHHPIAAVAESAYTLRLLVPPDRSHLAHIALTPR